ncbi:Sorting nexin-4 [Lamellibrachia satsuma]|nr:Sorting nexin-4 [Lamellibrachia satsuma]
MADEEVVDYSPELSKNCAESISENELAQKRDHLLQWMEVSVTEPEKRTGTSSVAMQDTYTVYLVETKVTDREMPGYGDPPSSIWRRYNEFELLRTYLEVMYPATVVPPLPEKRVSHGWHKLPTDRFDPDFIERQAHWS